MLLAAHNCFLHKLSHQLLNIYMVSSIKDRDGFHDNRDQQILIFQRNKFFFFTIRKGSE